MNHVTVGVYPNGECVTNIVKDEHLQDHIKYNATFRPGRMLFVDGKYVSGGMLKKEVQDKMVAEWEDKISKMSFITSEATIPYR